MLVRVGTVSAALLLSGALAAPALAGDLKKPASSSASTGELKPASSRLNTLLKRQVDRAVARMKTAAESVKLDAGDLLDELAADPVWATADQLSDEEILALADAMLARVDELVAAAQAQIAKTAESTIETLKKRQASSSLVKRVERGAASSDARAERHGDKAAREADRTIAALLEAGSDDESDDEGKSLCDD